MGNKIFGTLTRTATNVLFLGLVAAGTLFMSHLMAATGEKFMETLSDDVESLKGSTEQSEIRRVA